ncbi:hypothetical protein GTA08_BOTSDO14184 [Botryosphaeria dothidea]|uniref:CCD97-like C-terminal domain-containing protein n=1 Tax=Botryosphaeria dothidea TaxID=55169 RepID=A0A8H4ITE9_9PEZI|nr:hypothetical protein GTA08_BOTSDO14184 [Botryosphaeria dothidea]
MPFPRPRRPAPACTSDESTAPQIDASTDSPPSRNFNAPARAPQQLQPSLHDQLEQRRRLRDLSVDPDDEDAQARAHRIRYFSSGLELADPLLYDRLVRRFQTPAEREAEGRAKGYSGVLEADLLRDSDDEVKTKEEGLARWRDDMGQRFLRGEDRDFRYEEVDESEEWDDVQEEEREAQDKYFDDEDPSWIHSGQGTPQDHRRDGRAGLLTIKSPSAFLLGTLLPPLTSSKPRRPTICPNQHAHTQTTETANGATTVTVATHVGCERCRRPSFLKVKLFT